MAQGTNPVADLSTELDGPITDLSTDGPPSKTPSFVIFSLIREDTYLWTKFQYGRIMPTGMEIEELHFDGGYAALENEGCKLESALYGVLNYEKLSPGWWVIDSFCANYFQSWEGEWDASFSATEARPCTWADANRLGLVKCSRLVSLANWLGINPRYRGG